MNPSSYNPDVLSCIANLSSDEVFTPPYLANKMLDLLPKKIWRNKDFKFLDPVTKSGVFLREIVKRLDVGLESTIKDRSERINHILTNQVYGIAITQLTGLLSRRTLYCSKIANGKYSLANKFNNSDGNILFRRVDHTWVNQKCIYCSASHNIHDRGEELETHAYEFIHTDNAEDIFKMKFDVIVGNPPYQLTDGGGGRSASPIYQNFIEQAIKLKPRYLTMIIPARWYAGGKGLDEFRQMMLNNQHIRKLVDFQNSTDIFPGVDIAGGVCYFLWDRDNIGECEITNNNKDNIIKSERKLNEFDIFIRNDQSLSIVRKVIEKNKGKKLLSESVSSRQPFGISSTYPPKPRGIPCWFTQKQGMQYVNKSDVHDTHIILSKWKLLVAKAPIAGQTDFSKAIGFYSYTNTKIAKPGELCSESWLVVCAKDTEREIKFFRSYLFTKTVRFLLLQAVVSQNTSRKNFCFIPDLVKYDKEYTDKYLWDLWEINSKEGKYISEKITEINPELDI